MNLGNWHEAINLILKPRNDEQDKYLIEARRIYEETRDAKVAFNKLNNMNTIEAQVFLALTLHGNQNPQAVLNAIPKNIILMYLHAYQSFVWNNIVSRRLKEFGRKPVVGDLVFENTHEQGIDETTPANETESQNGNEDRELTCNLQKVKILTNTNVSKYSLKDIIMPQPGWRVSYPTYAVSWYDEFLNEDGLSKDLKQKNK